MNSAEKIARFVARLISLTNADQLDWKDDFFGHICNHKGAEIFVSWLSGDQPSISINHSAIEGYGYGLEGLIGSIDQHYRRQKKGRYSVKRRAEIQESEKRARQEVRDHINQAAAEIDKLKRKK